MTNDENGVVENPQLLGEVPTLIGGEIHRINDNEQQWATQHVTIIHQGPTDTAADVQKEPITTPSFVSWAVPNEDALTTVPISISSENSIIPQVK